MMSEWPASAAKESLNGHPGRKSALLKGVSTSVTDYTRSNSSFEGRIFPLCCNFGCFGCPAREDHVLKHLDVTSVS